MTTILTILGGVIGAAGIAFFLLGAHVYARSKEGAPEEKDAMVTMKVGAVLYAFGVIFIITATGSGG